MIFNSRWALGLAVIGASCLIPTATRAALVINGDFELPNISGNFTTYNTGANIGGWVVTSGSVDLINNYWQPASGGQSLDTAGNINGTIQQTVATTAGQLYRLTFDMSGNPDGLPTIKSLLVTFGSASQTFLFNTAGITKSNMKWTLMTWDVVATGASTLLSFASADSPTTAYGAALDNVALVPVPEPTTVIAGALLLLPFGASAFRIMRKGKQA